MNSTSPRVLRSLLHLFLAVLALGGLAACGGGVGPAQNVPNQAAIVILPASTADSPVIAYSGLPTTFSVTGGSGSYIVASSNQAAIASPGTFAGSAFTIVPNPVTAETTVTLTARDTGTATPVAATITVRPGTINNNVTIAPTSTISGCTPPALCSGGDALVVATLSQGGIPLAARGVRFETVTGDFRFVTSGSGTQEVLANAQTVVTDETGRAMARIRVLPSAPNQTAILQVTDLGTQAYQRTSFPIAQVTAGGGSFYAIPSEVTFSGARIDRCAQGVASSFFVFGGLPPYSVGNTNPAFTVTPTTVTASGGSFSVLSSGACSDPGFPIAITDSAGRSIAVTVTSKPGTDTLPDLVVAPSAVTISDCDSAANVTIVGGTGSYLQPSSGSSAVIATISGNTVSIRRLNPSRATTSPVSVGVSDGLSTVSITVNLTLAGLGVCPTSADSGFTVTPSSATVTGAANFPGVNLFLTGGTGTYRVLFVSDPRVVATVSGSTLNIDTLTECASPTTSISTSVTVTDGATNRTIPVAATICSGQTGNPLAVSPSSAVVSGTLNNPGVNLLISGGVPPYNVVFVSDPRIAATVSAASLNVDTASACAAPSETISATVTVRDTGSTFVNPTTVSVPVTATVCSTGSGFTAAPSSVSVVGAINDPGVNVFLSGGTGSYSVLFVSDPRVSALVSGSTLNIDTLSSCSAPGTTISATVVVSDGVTTVSIPVSATVCSSTGGSALSATPSSASIDGSFNNPGASIFLSGGTGSYAVTFVSDSRISASVAGATLKIDTVAECSSPSISVNGVVLITDGTSSLSIEVSARVCPTAGSTAFSATPSSVAITGTVGNPGANVFLQGGTGAYSILFVSDPRVVASLSGATLNIRTLTTCTNPGTAVTASVIVSDGLTTLSIPVSATACT